MPWSVSVVMTQLLPLYTGQGQLNLSETPRRRPGCGETRTRVSPLLSQCCCHDLTPPGSCRPQEVGARSLIDSTGNSEWSSACPGQPAPGRFHAAGRVGSVRFQQGCGSQRPPVAAVRPRGSGSAEPGVFAPLRLAGRESLALSCWPACLPPLLHPSPGASPSGAPDFIRLGRFLSSLLPAQIPPRTVLR